MKAKAFYDGNGQLRMAVLEEDHLAEVQRLEAKVAALEAETGRLREATDRWEEFASYLIRAEKNRAAYQGEDVLELAAKHAAQVINDCRAQQPSPAQDEPKRERLNKGQCAAQVVDCDCVRCIPTQDKEQG